ncbi:hypothetical protein OE749_17405 [Aestuariibacter sp. AA17]|uniref:HEAT repeat domain-containing protein n=1 Tax=Fluctibacter corallii TaxID=2984329 RepID=A0ABT3ACS1_9ALTE|nr:hypothetical protein [Aestuariibacter sp. AA17]MCV2886476.1 hypothetical protein [Aestuariibacter sp. AA17]
MDKEKIKRLSFIELREMFLNNEFVEDLEERHDAICSLHNKMEDVRDLIPLLLENDKNCQVVATFIATQEGDGAKPIFSPYIFDLLESPWEEVRDEVCDCFFNCDPNEEQIVSLIKHLKDPSERIRLRVISVLCRLSTEKLLAIHKYIVGLSNYKDLAENMNLLVNSLNVQCDFEYLKKQMRASNENVKVFSYVSTYKLYGNSEELSQIVNISNSEDIRFHHEIYFSEDED